MTLESERLEIVALDCEMLGKWLFDIRSLEKELCCEYKAQELEGVFREIVKNQYEICAADPENYLWHSFFWIIRKSDRAVVGSADFKDLPKNGEVEIGYGIGPEFEHHGYMTEAARCMCAWVLGITGVKTVIAETEKDGYASQRVLARCGFVKYYDGETLWWRKTK